MRRYRRYMAWSVAGAALLLVYLMVITLMMNPDPKEHKAHWDSGRFQRSPPETTKGTEKDELTPDMKAILRDAENVNNKRLQTVQSVCRKYNLGMFHNKHSNHTIKHPPVPQYGVFYFDRVNNWSFCPIYKAGSSTWLYNLCLLGGIPEDTLERSNKQLSGLARSVYPQQEPTDAEQLLQSTIKVLTVRHPFERLLSAYRDKLENTNYGQEHGSVYFYKSYGSKIVQKYRPGGNKTKSYDLLKPSQFFLNPQHSAPAGFEPTFLEFVRYLINLNPVYADDHWIPYYLYCTPCLLSYDVIAKVETLDVDQIYVIRSIGLQNKIRPRWRHKTQFVDNKVDQNEPSYFAKIYFKQLTRAEVQQLYEKYKIDFELFDYDYQKYLEIVNDIDPR